MDITDIKRQIKEELANEFIQEIHVLKNDNARLNKVVQELDKENERINKENERINKVVLELVKEKNQKFSKLFKIF